MRKKILVKLMLVVAVLGFGHSSGIYAGSASNGEQKVSSEPEKRGHWGWSVGKIGGALVGGVALGALGAQTTEWLTDYILNDIESLPVCVEKFLDYPHKHLYPKNIRGAIVLGVGIVGMVGGIHAGCKLVKLLQKKVAEPKTAEQQIEQFTQQTEESPVVDEKVLEIDEELLQELD